MAKISCFYKCGASGLTLENIEEHYQKHHSPLRAYPNQEFTCDSCLNYYNSSLLYSAAPSQVELANWYHYCATCARQSKSPPFHLKPKNMKKKKTKKTKKKTLSKKVKSKLKPKRSLKTKKTVKKSALTLTKPKKTSSTPAYYNCLLNQAKSGFKGKITKACSECRTKAPALNLAYKKEAQQLVKTYKQLGISLSKILSH